jgi:hypothetical protein
MDPAAGGDGDAAQGTEEGKGETVLLTVSIIMFLVAIQLFAILMWKESKWKERD